MNFLQMLRTIRKRGSRIVACGDEMGSCFSRNRGIRESLKELKPESSLLYFDSLSEYLFQ